MFAAVIAISYMNIQYRITRHPAEISKSATRYSLFAFSVLFSTVNSSALTPAIIPNIHNVSIKSIIVYSYIYEVADVGLRDYHFYIIIVCLIKITYGVRYLHSVLLDSVYSHLYGVGSGIHAVTSSIFPPVPHK